MRFFAIVLFVFLLGMIPAAQGLSATYEVTIDENGFSPPYLTINKDDTVTWLNRGALSHSVTSGVNGTANGIFDSGLLNPGDSFEYTFTFPDKVKYFDTADVSHAGTIAVNFSIIISPGSSVLPAAEGFNLMFIVNTVSAGGDRYSIFYDGILIFQGSLLELRQHPAVQRGYHLANSGGSGIGTAFVIPIPPYTLFPGVHSLSIEATDLLGTTVSDKVVYTVVWRIKHDF